MSQAEGTGWRRWFASTGQPPAWGLVRYAAGGLVAGGALGAALPQVRGRCSPPWPACSSLQPRLVVRRGSRAAWPHRFSGGLVGCAIALVATYLFWPRDDEGGGRRRGVPVAGA